MKLKTLAKKGAPILLCALSSAGVIATGVASAKATERLLTDDKTDWKVYIPTGGIALGTIACIAGSYILGKKQQAALLAGQMAIASSYGRYKESVRRVCGEERAIAVEEDHVIYGMTILGSTTLDVLNLEEPMLFKENMGGVIFRSTLSKVIQAEYHLNRNFVLGGEIALSDFYDFLGLHYDEDCENTLWEMDDSYYWIDFDHEMITLDTGEPACLISCIIEPELQMD